MESLSPDTRYRGLRVESHEFIGWSRGGRAILRFFSRYSRDGFLLHPPFLRVTELIESQVLYIAEHTGCPKKRTKVNDHTNFYSCKRLDLIAPISSSVQQVLSTKFQARDVYIQIA